LMLAMGFLQVRGLAAGCRRWNAAHSSPKSFLPVQTG
jgi:hypothetical protein